MYDYMQALQEKFFSDDLYAKQRQEIETIRCKLSHTINNSESNCSSWWMQNHNSVTTWPWTASLPVSGWPAGSVVNLEEATGIPT